MEVVRYTNELQKDWEQFIASSINGNFLHTRAFYNHNPANAEDDASLLFYRKGKLVAVLPAILYKGENGLILNSHLRSTYGGYIISQKIGMLEAVEMVNDTIEFAKSSGVKEIIVRNPFKILYDTLSDESDYAMWYHGFNIKYRELETYIDLRPPLDVIKSRYDKGTKYNTVKAWKTVTVEESNDLAGFWQMLTSNLQEKFGKNPVHNLAQIEELITNLGNDKIKLFGAFLDGKLIGGCVVFVFKNFLHAQYIAQDNVYQEHRCINAVTDHIINWGKEKGFSGFNLGTGNDQQGRYINEGLTHFKESFGGRGVLRETMHKII